MEHRYSERYPSDLSVSVSHNDTHALGRLKNLSTGGFYIATDSSVFTQYQRVTVDITLKDRKPPKHYRFSALVLRCEGDGIALELEAEDSSLPNQAVEFVQDFKRRFLKTQAA